MCPLISAVALVVLTDRNLESRNIIFVHLSVCLLSFLHHRASLPFYTFPSLYNHVLATCVISELEIACISIRRFPFCTGSRVWKVTVANNK